MGSRVRRILIPLAWVGLTLCSCEPTDGVTSSREALREKLRPLAEGKAKEEPQSLLGTWTNEAGECVAFVVESGDRHSFAVSAAHCAGPSFGKVAFGGHGSERTEVEVDGVIAHPMHRGNEHDVAVLRLRTRGRGAMRVAETQWAHSRISKTKLAMVSPGGHKDVDRELTRLILNKIGTEGFQVSPEGPARICRGTSGSPVIDVETDTVLGLVSYGVEDECEGDTVIRPIARQGFISNAIESLADAKSCQDCLWDEDVEVRCKPNAAPDHVACTKGCGTLDCVSKCAETPVARRMLVCQCQRCRSSCRANSFCTSLSL